MKGARKFTNAAFTMAFFILVFTGCSQQQKRARIGFGKADLSQAGIYEDPVSMDQAPVSGEKFKREEKFAISDRVEGRWRPGSGGVRQLADSIFVSAMYGEDAGGPWVIITVDATDLFYEDVDLVDGPVKEKLGIPKDRIVILPSHSHATPPLNPGKFRNAVFSAVKQAKEDASEVEVASLDLELDGKKYVMNRRVHVDGIGTRTVMFNDGCVIHDDYADVTEHIHDWVRNLGVDADKFFDPEKKYITDGDVDDHLQALFIRDKKSGRMKGSFVRFAAHAVIVSSKVVNGDVSADYPGYLRRKIERQLGGITLFGQGPCGDLRPLNREYSHAYARQYGEELADKILGNYDGLKWEPLTQMTFRSVPVALDLRENIFYSDDELKTEMDKVEALYDKETDPLKRRELQNRFWGLYRTPWVHKMIRPEWKESRQVNARVFGFQFNKQVVVAIQGEIFSGIARDMISPYKDKNPILVSIANEYISYIPADAERTKGGYEPAVSVVKPGSPGRLVAAVHKLLAEFYDNQ